MQLSQDYGQPFRLPPPLPGAWHLVGPETAALVAQRLGETIGGLGGRRVRAMRVRALAFYPDCALVDLQLAHADGSGVHGACFVEGFHCLYAPEGPLLPPREGNPHGVRGLFTKLVLDSPEAQEDYLHYALRAAFVEGAPRIALSPEAELVEITGDGKRPVPSPDLPPPTRIAAAPGELARFSVMTLHRGTLSEAEIALTPSGTLQERRCSPRPGRYALVPDLVFNGALRAAQFPLPFRGLPEPEMPRVPWALKLPPIAGETGLLIGWSMEDRTGPTPAGFSTFVPFSSPEDGVARPILMTAGASLMTFAPKGAGRRSGCLLPALHRHEGSIVLMDRAGVSAEISAACRRAIGQEVISLDPLGLGRLKAGGFNPLDLFDGDMQEDEVVAAVLADALLPGPEGDTEGGADATGLARRLLQALLLLVGTRTQGPGRTLTEVLRLADKLRDKPAATRRILSATRHPFPRALAEDPVIARPDALAPAIDHLGRVLEVLRAPGFRQVTDQSTFDSAEVGHGKRVTIALVIPPDPDPAFSGYLRLMIAALLLLFQGLQQRRATAPLFLLDEAAVLGALPGLPADIVKERKTGPQIWTFWHDAAEFRATHPDNWSGMLATSAAVQSFGPGAWPIEDIAEPSALAAPDLPALEPREMFLRLGQTESVIAQRPDQSRDGVRCRARLRDRHACVIDDTESSETRITHRYRRADRTVHLRDGSDPEGGPSRRELPYENAIDEWIRDRLLGLATEGD